MKAGFTKGEWKYHEPKGVFHARLGSSNGETIAVFKTTPLLGDARILCAAPDLAEALAPFAALLQSHNERGLDDQPIFGINNALIKLGDLRKAVAALKKAGVEL